MQLGMIGLGRMGGNTVRRLIKNGHECVVYDPSPQLVNALVGLERGYCMMIGGEPDVVKHLDPIFASLAPGRGNEIPRTPGREKLLFRSSRVRPAIWR